jgi:hypothetical protein
MYRMLRRASKSALQNQIELAVLGNSTWLGLQLRDQKLFPLLALTVHCSANDIVGCGVDFSHNRTFYTKNGAFLGKNALSCPVFHRTASENVCLGHVFENIDGEHPIVSLWTPGEAIRANFSQQLFKFDIESYAHLQQNAVWFNHCRLPGLPPRWRFKSPTQRRTRSKPQA